MTIKCYSISMEKSPSGCNECPIFISWQQQVDAMRQNANSAPDFVDTLGKIVTQINSQRSEPARCLPMEDHMTAIDEEQRYWEKAAREAQNSLRITTADCPGPEIQVNIDLDNGSGRPTPLVSDTLVCQTPKSAWNLHALVIKNRTDGIV